MSDRLREALEQYDDGEADTHQVSELAAAARRFLALTETGPLICGREVETYDGPFLCGHPEREEIHHPVHGHEFVPVYLIPADYLTEEE